MMSIELLVCLVSGYDDPSTVRDSNIVTAVNYGQKGSVSIR